MGYEKRSMKMKYSAKVSVEKVLSCNLSLMFRNWLSLSQKQFAYFFSPIFGKCSHLLPPKTTEGFLVFSRSIKSEHLPETS